MNNIEQSNSIMDSEEILEFLGLDHLPDEQKTQVMEGLMAHLSSIVVETLTENLTPEQAEKLEKDFTSDPIKAQTQVQDIASKVPGLNAKIQMAIRQELEILKSGFDQVKA